MLPNQMNYPVLAQRVRYFKEDTKGVTNMCRIIEEVREESAREAERKAKMEIARSMLADGFSYETIARHTKFSVDEIKALDTQKSA